MGPQIQEILINLTHPSDVTRENKIIKDVIDEINRNIRREGFSYRSKYWLEDTRPGLHLQGGQGIIDQHMQFENADVVIGIFKSRFGSPVKDANSGTEHEIRNSIKLNKKNNKPEIFLYFSDPNVRQSQIDLQQLGRIRAFKEEFANLGLYFEYKSLIEFKKLIRAHLEDFYHEFKETLNEVEKKVTPNNLSNMKETKPPTGKLVNSSSDSQSTLIQSLMACLNNNDKDCFLILLAHHLNGDPWETVLLESVILSTPHFYNIINHLIEENLVRYEESKLELSITLKGFYYAYELSKSSNNPEYFGLLYYNELKDLAFRLLDIIREREQKEGYFNAATGLRDYGEQIPKQCFELLEEEGYIVVTDRTKVNTTPKGISKIIQNRIK